MTTTPVAPPKPTISVATAPKAVSAMNASKDLANGKDRRRSQRVLLRVKVKLHVILKGAESVFETVTLNVNAHGALVAAPQSFPVGTVLVLEHNGTKECVGCKVVRMPVESPEGYQTALEFDSSRPKFWRIAFPPADWTPVDL
jgi:hypothetical protein